MDKLRDFENEMNNIKEGSGLKYQRSKSNTSLDNNYVESADRI